MSDDDRAGVHRRCNPITYSKCNIINNGSKGDIMREHFSPQDYARCDNERCDKRNSCARFLDILPFDGYFYCGFNENDCDFYIEKKGIKPKKKKR